MLFPDKKINFLRVFFIGFAGLLKDPLPVTALSAMNLIRLMLLPFFLTLK